MTGLVVRPVCLIMAPVLNVGGSKWSGVGFQSIDVKVQKIYMYVAINALITIK